MEAAIMADRRQQRKTLRKIYGDICHWCHEPIVFIGELDASICPLEPQVGIHLNGERVCYYLLNSVKAGADERFAADPVYQAVKANREETVLRSCYIARALRLSAQSGFRSRHLIKTQ
jgi:hypothetical protein